MELVNTNRLRVSVGNQRKHWDAPWWLFQHYRSGDHGKARHEHNFTLGLFGRCIYVKWRPDGKY